MAKVISIQERTEVWKSVYVQGNLEVFISNHGKFKLRNGKEITELEFFDSVTFLKDLSEALENVMGKMGMYNQTH